VETRLKGTKSRFPALAVLSSLALASAASALLVAQSPTPSEVPAPASAPALQASAEPPANPAIFPLSQVRPGMTATAWTVFQGATPEPMQVEILGILRNTRGPGQDMILARLHGAKPEYTGVVEGMSGSPVYIGDKLVGSLSYRIGQFTKEPIAGITPIEQMFEIRDIPVRDLSVEQASDEAPAVDPFLVAANATAGENPLTPGAMTFQPMDTPLVMTGFFPDAIRFWQQQTAGTPLSPVAAGGSLGGASSPTASGAPDSPVASPPPTLQPGSAVSMQLVRGDLEVAATCTVTWVDPKQLLACGHPVLGAGPVSLPMTTADVVVTLASPLNSFKIVNTGVTIGAFTQDRESAIRGVFGATAHMIPVHVTVDAPQGPRKVNVDILDLPSLTPLAIQVVLYQSLLQSNLSSEALSYHVTGNIDVAGFPLVPVDFWAPTAGSTPAPLLAALLTGNEFSLLYTNGARQGAIRSIDLHVQGIPRQVEVLLEQARIVSTNLAHAGDTVEVEATVRPRHQPARNIRISFKLPDRLASGSLRLLVSDATTLDRTLLQPHPLGAPIDLATVLAVARNQHPADRVYVSLLAPETQGEIHGQTLTSLPLSVANALEPLRNAESAGLNGESAELVGEAPAGGVLSGFQILNLHIESGGGLE
jgi:hypothetical protein